MQHCITCSPMDPLQWMGAVRMRVQTADKAVKEIKLFSSKDINCWTGVMWITCGLLWCFYQLFGLSFWRHPFTAEDPLVSKWWKNKFLQICSDEETKSSTSWIAWGWVNFQKIFSFDQTSFNVNENNTWYNSAVTRKVKLQYFSEAVILYILCWSTVEYQFFWNSLWWRWQPDSWSDSCSIRWGSDVIDEHDLLKQGPY